MVETHTEYLPNKSVTAALEFNVAQKQMRAIFDVNQVSEKIFINTPSPDFMIKMLFLESSHVQIFNSS